MEFNEEDKIRNTETDEVKTVRGKNKKHGTIEYDFTDRTKITLTEDEPSNWVLFESKSKSKSKFKLKQAANKVIIANRFRVHRSEEEEQELEKIDTFQKSINTDELLEKIKSDETGIDDDYTLVESRGFVEKMLSAISAMINPPKPPPITRTSTPTIAHTAKTHVAITPRLSLDFIHPPLPVGWTETNDTINHRPVFTDNLGNHTYDRPYVPLPSTLGHVGPKVVSCTIIGHGGLVGVYPRLFSPGPMCHVRYVAPFANPVLASHTSDTRGYTLQLPTTSPISIADPNAVPADPNAVDLQPYEDDFTQLYDNAYNQHRFQGHVPINVLRKKTTDSVTCLNKSFSFLEKINLQAVTPAEIEYEKGIQRINEANFGVYIMRNNLGIKVGHKLDITGIDGYPDNVLFQDIAGLITVQLNLISTDQFYALDPTCNPIVYLGDTDNQKRFMARNYEQLIDDINKDPTATSDVMSERLYRVYRRVFFGGSKRRKQKKTRKNKKQKTKKNKKM